MLLILVLKVCEINLKRYCCFSGQVVFDHFRVICVKRTTSSHVADFFQNGLIYHMRIFARDVGPIFWSHIALVLFRIAWNLRQDDN